MLNKNHDLRMNDCLVGDFSASKFNNRLKSLLNQQLINFVGVTRTVNSRYHE